MGVDGKIFSLQHLQQLARIKGMAAPNGTISQDVLRACQLLEKLEKSTLCGEGAANKLAELKKVLQSEFLQSVKGVYEHVYQNVHVQGSPAVRSSASAKATLAAFLASEDLAHPRMVELPKTRDGLGFNVMGGQDHNAPIYISRIVAGGVASRHGGLKRGDQLLSVNGVSLEGHNHKKAAELLKAANNIVKLEVKYNPRVLDQMETSRTAIFSY